MFPAGQIVLAVGGVCVKLNGQRFEGGVSTLAQCASVCTEVAEPTAGETADKCRSYVTAQWAN